MRDEPLRIRRTVLFSGNVQGVGFRYTTQSLATSFQVSGFVRNLPNGRVELVVEGVGDELDRFQAAVAAALEHHIRNTSVEESPETSEFTSFRIAH